MLDYCEGDEDSDLEFLREGDAGITVKLVVVR